MSNRTCRDIAAANMAEIAPHIRDHAGDLLELLNGMVTKLSAAIETNDAAKIMAALDAQPFAHQMRYEPNGASLSIPIGPLERLADEWTGYARQADADWAYLPDHLGECNYPYIVESDTDASGNPYHTVITRGDRYERLDTDAAQALVGEVKWAAWQAEKSRLDAAKALAE